MASDNQQTSNLQKFEKILEEEDEEEVEVPVFSLASSRRRSISVPQGLDLLLTIAQHSWLTKPPLNSSFDDLTPTAAAQPNIKPSNNDSSSEDHITPLPPTPPMSMRKNRRVSQVIVPSKSGLNYEPVHSESEEFTEDEDALSFIDSEGEQATPKSKKKRVGLDSGKRRRSGVVNYKKKKDGDEDDDDELNFMLRPLAARRNSSGIPPIHIEDSNFLKSDPLASPIDGHTTDDERDSPLPKPVKQNSRASRLKAIIKQKLPKPPKFIPKNKKPPTNYKIQLFVAVLFLIIVMLVGSISVIHKERELQKSYFDGIRFSSKDRKIRISNQRDQIILSGELGVNLSKKDKAWPCLTADEREDNACLEWMNKARLYLRTKQGVKGNESAEASSSPAKSNLRCYEVYWVNLDPGFELKDCFSLRGGAHFYGGGEIPGADHWPLNKTRVEYGPFLTGSRGTTLDDLTKDSSSWGRTLRRYFLNSYGAAIQVTEDTPLHVSINDKNDGKLCIGSRPHPGYTQTHIQLNYTICSGENVKDTAESLAEKDIWDGLKHEDIQVTRALAQSPIWRIPPQTISHGMYSEAALLNYTDAIVSLHLSEGYVLLDESWQKYIGDLEMDPDRFPSMEETLSITRRRGFKVALTIQPYFSTQSRNYEEGVEQGIWLSEEGKGVPALTRYKNWTSVAVLDVTKPAARYWLERKVVAAIEKYKIDALYVKLGTAYDLPQFFQFASPLSSSDYFKDLFLKALRPLQHVRVIAVSSAVHLPKLPTFVSLSPTESSWEGLQSVVSNILTMGVAGYPFILPGAIGGDYFPSLEKRTHISYRTSTKGSLRVPDRELYIRWLELVHFLPIVQYTFLPSDYDQKVVDIATNMYITRKNKLYPYIKKAIDQSLTTGLPVIRPLWMIDPTDANCLKVSDEFSIGDDIIVAPILEKGMEERDIYLPKGIWRNEIDGSPTKGEKWLHHYRVKEHQVAFFTKIMSNEVIGGGGGEE